MAISLQRNSSAPGRNMGYKAHARVDITPRKRARLPLTQPESAPWHESINRS